MEHAPRAEVLAEVREVGRLRVVLEFGLLFGVQVVQVAKKLVEPVHRREVLITVAQMVLTELPGGIAVRLERRCDRRVFGLEANCGTREAHLGQACPGWILPADECSPPRRAGLLPVVVGEPNALIADPVDVGGAIPHQAVAVTAEVGDPDVVTPDNQDVRLSVRHVTSSKRRFPEPNVRGRRVNPPANCSPQHC